MSDEANARKPKTFMGARTQETNMVNSMSVDQSLLAKYQRTLDELRGVSLTLQQYKARMLEIEKTLKSLEESQSPYVYKAMGNLLIQASKDEVVKELNSEKELLQLRIGEFSKREKLLRERLASIEKQLRSPATTGGAG